MKLNDESVHGNTRVIKMKLKDADSVHLSPCVYALKRNAHFKMD